MRTTVLTAGVLLLVMLAAACGAQPGDEQGAGTDDAPTDVPTPGAAPTAPTEGPTLDPVELIGLWSVGDVDEPGAVLRLAQGSYEVIRSCGLVSGSWRADLQGLFVASSFGGSDACIEEGDEVPVAPWLLEAAGYRVESDGPVLVDADGATVAALRPTDAPAPPPGVAPQVVAAPTPDPATREALRPAAPLPGDLEPATIATLVGRWVPTAPDGATEPPAPDAHITFADDRSWSGSDGCNGMSARWTAGDGGSLLASTGASTLMGCPGQVPIGAWLDAARRAGLYGDVLVLLDADGAEIGRLRPADG